MTDLTYGQCRLLYPVVIDETLAWIENGTPLSIDVDGTYWVYQGTSVSGVDGALDRLFAQLAVDMTAESASSGEGYTYVFARATPTHCPELPYSGITLTGGALFTSLSSAGTTDVLMRCLGLEAGGSGTPSGGVLRSKYSLYGEWWAADYPVDLRGDTQRIGERSTEYTERADFYLVDRGTRSLRDIKFEHVGGAHIFAGRSSDPKYAASSGIGVGDPNNALIDLWTSASQGKQLLAVYHTPSEIPTITRGTQYEVLALEAGDTYESFRSLLDERDRGGEFYDVYLPCVQIVSGFDY